MPQVQEKSDTTTPRSFRLSDGLIDRLDEFRRVRAAMASVEVTRTDVVTEVLDVYLTQMETELDDIYKALKSVGDDKSPTPDFTVKLREAR